MGATAGAACHPRRDALVSTLMVGCCLAALVLHSYPLTHPWLFDDDFSIVAQSWTWQATRTNLWVPANEHAMPLGRLTTFGQVQLAGRQTAVPLAAALQGPLAVVLAMVLIAVFVGREMRHPFFGLVAMVLFGVSLKYNEAVSWFAASFVLLALDTLLLALLAAQRWRRTGRPTDLALSALAAGLAPAWFASGILAGPLCGLYLWPWGERGRGAWRGRAAAAVPTLGSLAFLTLSLPLTARSILHTGHHRGRTALQALDPVFGLVCTGRAIVDNLVFGAAGASGYLFPLPLVAVGLLVLAVAGWFWWRQVREHRLMLLGLALIGSSYWLSFCTRTAWSYDEQMYRWSRYHALPFLGLVLFVVTGLPGRQGSLFVLDPTGRLTRRQAAALIGLLALLFGLQFPLSVVGHRRTDPPDIPEQRATLQRVEDVDALCRQHGISAEAAREVLPPLVIPLSYEARANSPPRINGWELLWGSPTPQPLPAAEVRRLLGVDRGPPSLPDAPPVE